MGSIGEFMRFVEFAQEKFERNDGRILRGGVTGGQREVSGVEPVGPKRTSMVAGVMQLLNAHGHLPTEQIMEQVGCSSETVAYARAKFDGRAWGRPGKLSPPGVRRGPRAAK